MSKMITILGPTASGKTPVAAALAARTGGEILSADSRQGLSPHGYRNGQGSCRLCGGRTSRALSSYRHCGARNRKYNLFQYQQDFHTAYADIRSRGKLPILCGGTGLYILRLCLGGYRLSPVPQNPELRQRLSGECRSRRLPEMLAELKQRSCSVMHNTTDVDTAQRAIRAIEIETYNLENPTSERQLPAVDSLIIGIDIDRELRREKITRRLKARLDEGHG